MCLINAIFNKHQVKISYLIILTCFLWKNYYLLHIYILYCSNSISLWFCYSILTLYPKITSKYRIKKNNFLILASRLRWIQYSKNTLPSHRLVYCLRLTLADCDRDERQIGTYLNKRRRTTTCHDRAAWKLWRYVPALRHLYFE